MSRGDRREPIFKDDIDRRRLVETLTEACLKTGWEVHVYSLIHLNAVRAKLVGAEAALRTFVWSSSAGYLEKASRRPVWLRVDRLLGEHGIRRLRTETSGAICGADGVWGTKRFVRNCWAKSLSKKGRTTTGRSAGRVMNRERSGWWWQVLSKRDGRRRIWLNGARPIR